MQGTEVEKTSTTLPKNTISGKVLEADTKEPVAFANVLLEHKGELFGVNTDLDGAFILSIPDSLLTENIALTISCVGYNKVQFSVSQNDLPFTKEILLFGEYTMGLMEVIVVGKKKWWQFWK